MYYLILDLEMSGTEAGYHDIIQIGAVLAGEKWTELGAFETLVYPDNEETFNSYAEAVHGISLDDLQEAPSSYEALEAFEAWIRKTLRRKQGEPLTDVIVCGQSVLNDVNFLEYQYDALNLEWPFARRILDLVSLTILFYGIFDSNGRSRPKSYSLDAVAGMFGIARAEGTHNALEDARITFACFRKYFEIAGGFRL
ncbi:MAG TPA: 3'-5' exonuclease [Bacteroidales bacterium]|nr:3'-5' exonuclease [Bacteroidales bacterium]